MEGPSGAVAGHAEAPAESPADALGQGQAISHDSLRTPAAAVAEPELAGCAAAPTDAARAAALSACVAGAGAGRPQPRVASSAPFRIHILMPKSDGSAPECDCGRQHMLFGSTYRYCTCGLSKKQPFCDDVGHVDTGFSPLEFVCDKKQSYYLLCGW
jgi:CDGSH-type Zn-finger protein